MIAKPLATFFQYLQRVKLQEYLQAGARGRVRAETGLHPSPWKFGSGTVIHPSRGRPVQGPSRTGSPAQGSRHRRAVRAPAASRAEREPFGNRAGGGPREPEKSPPQPGFAPGPAERGAPRAADAGPGRRFPPWPAGGVPVPPAERERRPGAGKEVAAPAAVGTARAGG